MSGVSSPGKRALLLLLIALIAAVVAAGDADDPLADLEDPLDGFDDVGLDQEARRAEDGPDARQQQQQPPPRGEEPKRPSPGMQWWAKYAWSAVIGGAVLYMFRGFWNACPSIFTSAAPLSQRRKASSSHLIKPVVTRSDLDKIVKDARIALVDFLSLIHI